MLNAINPINKPVAYPSQLFVDAKGSYSPVKIMTCQMSGDSMQPTIQPCELIAFADCCGRIAEPGIYVFTRNVFGRPCVFIKRIEPMQNGAVVIISDNSHYETFSLEIHEQSDMQVHGRVIASMTMRCFV